MKVFQEHEWALILGGSSGFGLASAQKLASMGMNVCVVHRDRRGAMKKINEAFDRIKAMGVQFFSCNVDALSDEGQAQVVEQLQTTLGAKGKVKLLLHSIAFGNLKPIAPEKQESASLPPLEALSETLNIPLEQLKDKISQASEQSPALSMLQSPQYGDALIEKEDMERTIFSMGTSMLGWTQALHVKGLFASDARVIGLTSEGNEVAWKGYAAVSAAKVALESVSRSIAVEFAAFGIRSNIIQAGVTDTPALRLIPGSDRMKAVAQLKNPFKRLTQPEDVANVIALMAMPESAWINGTIVRVDGGERIASL